MELSLMQENRIRAVVFDWAGTMVDYGSRAPATVFQEIFKQEGIEISAAQAREPMGMAKREHIAAIAEMPEVAVRWREKFGSNATTDDVNRMYEKFLPMQKQVLNDHSDLIPGSVETFQWCVQQGIRVGSSTGYTRELMDVVEPFANAAGYQPEVVLCAEDAPTGRPAPWLIFECAKRFNIYPLKHVVKVDDTVVGVQAGINAGCWSIGIAQTGNLIGLSQAEWNELAKTDQCSLLECAREKLHNAGAHYVVDGVADVPDIITKINAQLEHSQVTA